MHAGRAKPPADRNGATCPAPGAERRDGAGVHYRVGTAGRPAAGPERQIPVRGASDAGSTSRHGQTQSPHQQELRIGAKRCSWILGANALDATYDVRLGTYADREL